MKPILFNTEMVKAILDDRKTQTRRPIGLVFSKGFNKLWTGYQPVFENRLFFLEGSNEVLVTNKVKAKYLVNDILYVRETWCDRWLPDGFLTGANRYGYKANGVPDFGYWGNDKQCKDNVWIPSIHMPKEASRIFLKVTDVRVERLNYITEESAIAEGMPTDDDYPLENKVYCAKCNGTGLLGALGRNMGYTEVDCQNCDTAKKRFMNLWDLIYSDYSSSKNPWVFVYEFERCDKEGNVIKC